MFERMCSFEGESIAATPNPSVSLSLRRGEQRVSLGELVDGR